MELRKNQSNAINASISNDFESGIHYHATGTGKSIIGYELLLNFHRKYPFKNIIWICEQKSILNEQFNKSKLKELNYDKILTQFNVYNYVNNKRSNWYESLNSINYWSKKPILLIINRAFCVSGLKYKKLKINFDLVIHDECHTIVNQTTQEFYKWMLSKNKDIKCIGLTATPDTNYKPFEKLLSTYSIFDGVKDKVILPPRIIWFESEDIIEQNDILELFCKIKSDLVYQKVIIWCGLISLCIKVFNLWSNKLKDENFKFCIDVNKDNKILENENTLLENNKTLLENDL